MPAATPGPTTPSPDHVPVRPYFAEPAANSELPELVDDVPELNDVVAFTVQFGPHDEPRLAVRHANDLSDPGVPGLGARNTMMVPTQGSPKAPAPSGKQLQHLPAAASVRHPEPTSAHEGFAVRSQPRSQTLAVSLLLMACVVAAAAFGYFTGRQHAPVTFANLPPTAAGPAPGSTAAPAAPPLSSTNPAPALEAAVPPVRAAAAEVPTPAAPPVAAAPASPTTAALAAPPAVPPPAQAPPVAAIAPIAPAPAPPPVRAAPARTITPPVAATSGLGATFTTPVDAAPALAISPPPPHTPAVPCTQAVAALGLCTLAPTARSTAP